MSYPNAVDIVHAELKKSGWVQQSDKKWTHPVLAPKAVTPLTAMMRQAKEDRERCGNPEDEAGEDLE